MSLRILLIKLSALGDVIQTLPTLESLRAAFPRADITWLVEEAAAPILFCHPALDTLLVSRRRSWLQAWQTGRQRRAAWQEFRGLVRALRAQPYDLVIDLQGLLKSAFWTALARSPRKLGFDRTRELSYLALSERLPPYDPDEHALRRYLGVAQYIGASSETVRFRLALPPGTGAGLTEIWNGTDGPRLVIHPGTRWETKHWPPEFFAAVADRLIRERRARIVFTGSPADRPLIARIQSGMTEPAVDLSGRTDLPTLAWLFHQADAALTTDTGPMHLAAAVGAPVVAVFGPTAPWRTGPFGGRHRVVRRHLPCSPCFQRQCPDPQCLTGLGAEEVVSAVQEILDRPAPRLKKKLPRQLIQGRVCEIIDYTADVGSPGGAR